MQELIKLGLFDTQKQSELMGPATTLRERSRVWIQDMKDGRVLTKKKQTRYTLTTISGYTSALEYLNAKSGDTPLAEIEANDVYELLIEMRKTFEPGGNRKFSDKTIREYYLVLKLAIESAVNPKTRQPMYRKDWTAQQIGLPSVNKLQQKRPKLSTNHVEDIIGKATGQYAVLYSLLAGSGVRIREALALEVKLIGPKGRTVNVCQQQCKITGEVKPHGKTDAAIRRVDLHSDLGLLLTDYIGSRRDGSCSILRLAGC
jgi:integrase